MKNNEILAQIICFDKKDIKNNQTGEVKTMYSVDFAVQTAPYANHYGATILNSYCSESAFGLLKEKVGKTVKLELGEKQVYGRSNTYKKVVSAIDGTTVRNF